ncbi:hypothetical protein DJ030_12535 [bacterium endosymbiont of Escarpia laminata]|nr:MAG: hypothetical protein DJ031_12095 [bacterium endosymbiont of Escarpia laminata]RLJ18212.1 MAG: hypothetical protein DJ030_12535 [bacterium endosymbiont of Escarpia laminata]
MKRKLGLMVALLGMGLLGNNAMAEGFALTGKAGSLGLGLEGTLGMTESLNARLGFNGFNYDYSYTLDDTDYDLTLDLQTISLLADWHPFDSGFRVSAGLMSNNNELTGRALPVGGSLNIGGTDYDVGLDAIIGFNSTAPYLGIGWGNAISADKGWGFNLDVGVLFQGSPEVSLTPFGADAGIVDADDLAAEVQRVESDLENFKYYPVVSLGVSYKF